MLIRLETVIGVLVFMRSQTLAQTGYRLVGTVLDSVLDKKNGSPPCKGIRIPPGRQMVGNVFAKGGGRQLNLSCLPQPAPIPCHRNFFVRGDGQQHCRCTLAGPVLAYCVTAGADWRPQNDHSNGRGCI